MPEVLIDIVRFVEAYQPGIVECVLIDAYGHSHIFVEKAPIVSQEDLWSDSKYPQDGAIACEIVEEWEDKNGTPLVKISTMNPWSVESVEGLNEFVVRSSQVTKK